MAAADDASDAGPSDAGPGPLPRSRSHDFALSSEMTVVLDDRVPLLPAEVEADRIFADEWTDCIVLDLLKAQGGKEISVGPWCPDEGDAVAAGARRSQTRKVSVRLPVPPAPMAPATTRSTIIYRVSDRQREQGTSICIEAQLTMHDVPYGSAFLVQEVLWLVPQDGYTSVSKEFDLVFVQSTFLESTIRSSTKSSQVESGKAVLNFLRQRADAAGGAGVANAAGGAGFAVDPAEVWEVQRLSGSGRWKAPAAPGDGDKRWRWVDPQYRKHTWVDGTQFSCGVSTYPPLKLPAGWRIKGGGHWEVVKSGGSANDDCWEYASDFLEASERWTEPPTTASCRRRRWRYIPGTLAHSEAAQRTKNKTTVGQGETTKRPTAYLANGEMRGWQGERKAAEGENHDSGTAFFPNLLAAKERA